MKNHKILWTIIFILTTLLVFLVFLLLKCRSSSSIPTCTNVDSIENSKISDKPSVTETTKEQTPPQDIIKCQSIVVTPEKTVELFEYISGKMYRADYRVNSTKEEDANKYQILYDGNQQYVWIEQPRFDAKTPLTNQPAYKTKLDKYQIKTDLSKLDQKSDFSEVNFSGDRICYKWDDVDPVFKAPSEINFIEDLTQAIEKTAENISKICKICEQAKSPDTVAKCRKNLQCSTVD